MGAYEGSCDRTTASPSVMYSPAGRSYGYCQVVVALRPEQSWLAGAGSHVRA